MNNTIFVYDPSGNMTEKQSAELSEELKDKVTTRKQKPFMIYRSYFTDRKGWENVYAAECK